MMEHGHIISNVSRFLVVGLLIIGNVFLLSLLISSFSTANAQHVSSSPSSMTFDMSDSPNAVSRSMAIATDSLNRSLDATQKTVTISLSSITKSGTNLSDTISNSGSYIARSASNAAAASAHAAATSVLFTGRMVGNSALFVLRIPGRIGGSIAKSSVVSALVKAPDSTPVTIIDPNSPELFAARAALPATPAPKTPTTASAPSAPIAVWPIHGAVTTEFGASDWPYQLVHTGIDISDGRAPGVTPVHPFRPGRVIEIIHSNLGLGNHIVIDHGSGVTSVYGHLASTAVLVGQQVDEGTVLGYEGTTGASTGTHLHFEIRVNNQAANPRQFISGQP
jgi:murein DD-endopeptidase MepM/ murein hydrolase activator NlpD